MDRDAFRALLAEGPLLSDGGTGTGLASRGVRADACFDALVVEQRDLVRDVHRGFVEAGARVVETNTFGANRFKLAQHGYQDRVAEINIAGVARAREAGAEFVAGSVGPLGVRLAPYGRVRAEDAHAAFAEQIAALAQGGADLLFIETHSDVAELEIAVRAAREICDLPIVATVTFTRDDRTVLGESPQKAARALAALGVDAMGVNCSEGPEQVLRIVTAMRPYAAGLALAAQPNAGGPQPVGGRILYSATPEYLAEYAVAFRDAGVSIIGGCCGTQPSHIRAMAAALAAHAPSHDVRVDDPAEPDESGERLEPTALANAFARGDLVIAVEMDPPKGVSVARTVAGAETLRAAGATVINVADSPMARMRMSPWAAAHLIQREAGVETVLHFPTRGRNLLRIQSDLLAAHALGIRNLFAVLGDSTRIGDFPDAADLADVTPSGLIALIKTALNEGLDRSGTSIGDPTGFFIGCAVNLNAADLEREARVLARKIAAGADFALSQAIFEPARLARFRDVYEDAHGPLRLPLLAGVLPLVTRRHAEFLHNEVPGVDVPEEIRKRMGHATDERGEGIRIALDLVDELRGSVAGFYLVPPFRRYDLAADLIERIRG